jgi:hypothetical protein
MKHRPSTALPFHHPQSRILYASGVDGDFCTTYHRTGKNRLEREIHDSELIGAAEELADELRVGYAARFLDKLGEQNYPDPVSKNIGASLVKRAWHEPRVTLNSPSELKESLGDNELDVATAPNDSVVINFRLPLPLEAFWHKRVPNDDEELPEIASGWGNLYYALMDEPWLILGRWQESHPDFSVCRLNPIWSHVDGKSGYYYLFAVSRRDAALIVS